MDETCSRMEVQQKGELGVDLEPFGKQFGSALGTFSDAYW
jgi:hypothetical protein